MKETITEVTSSEEYKNTYEGEYANYFQIHIYSMPEIISTYYNPEDYNVEKVQEIAETKLAKIRIKSNRRDKITLFARNGKFLISEDTEFIDQGEPLVFNKKRMCYEYDEYFESADDILGGIKIDNFIKNSFITVGAEDLYETVEPFVNEMRKANDDWALRQANLRELNKTDPKLILEIYRIEKDYKPVLKESIPIHSYDAIFLPEYKSIIQSEDDRITYLIRDIATKKIIEGNLRDDIEGLKFEKWQRKHPSIIDPEAMLRMELDNDDPNFLSYDDYVANDDEFEEGDDEYSW